ncbi:MAG TPA: hypothetical protein VG711_12135 [Phycisphaerales bacterium]|nr:hypothetical protein [Phycisphaerales bacterium]
MKAHLIPYRFRASIRDLYASCLKVGEFGTPILFLSISLLVLAGPFQSAALGFAVPPLTAEQHARLQTAHDGRDLQEEAFAALAENLREWPADAAAQLPQGTPTNPLDWSANPDAHRGELAIVAGKLEQLTPLTQPYDTVLECFCRSPQGAPILVYLLRTPNKQDPAVDSVLSIPVRFYKNVKFIARDNTPHAYAAFVGIEFDVSAATSSGSSNAHAQLVFALLCAVLTLAVVFHFIRARVRRGRTARNDGLQTMSRQDELREHSIVSERLPDDPAGALEELRQRARG